jgi:predicted permease
MLSAIAATLAIVALGYFLKQKDFLPDTVWQSLSPLCYWVLFPGLLFDLMTTMELSAAVLGPFTLTIAAASAVIVCYAIVAGRAAGMDGPAHSSLVQGALRHNGFLVLSILQGAFGVAALQLAAVAIAFLVPISNIVSVIAILVLTGKGDDRGMKRAILAEILRNPLLGAMAVGVGVNLLQIPVPAFIASAAAMLGNGALPLLLLSIGASLRFSAIRGHALPLGLAIAAKILVFPAVLVGIGYALGLDALSLAVLAAVGAAPTANSTYTLAAELGGDARLMAEIISTQTVMAALSMPFWIWMAGWLARG